MQSRLFMARQHEGMHVKLSVIMPVYNEESTIAETLKRVASAPAPPEVEREIIMVDDGSRDRSVECARAADIDSVRIFMHRKNRGKGAAVRTGLAAATGDIILIQDADLEYDPKDYPRLLEPIIAGRADVVYGSRFVSSDTRRVHLFRHYLGNLFLTFLSNWFSNYNLSDMETCYKVFRAELAKKLTLRENRFGFEPEITQKFSRLNARVYEVGIAYHGRDFEEGKKIRPFKDGLWALFCIIRYGLGLG